jgi:hypothetical protein
MDVQHLRIGSKLHQFTTQVPSTSAPEPLINGVATDVTVTNITDAYYEVEFDFVPTGPTSPVLGVVQVIPWSAPFIVDQD